MLVIKAGLYKFTEAKRTRQLKEVDTVHWSPKLPGRQNYFGRQNGNLPIFFNGIALQKSTSERKENAFLFGIGTAS